MSLRSLLLIACLIVVAIATPIVIYEENIDWPLFEEQAPQLTRLRRSPGGGSVQVDYNADQYGRRAGVQYNQNLFKSSDGRLTVDAYARGDRNFDRNRNSYGGGVQGTYHFG